MIRTLQILGFIYLALGAVALICFAGFLLLVIAGALWVEFIKPHWVMALIFFATLVWGGLLKLYQHTEIPLFVVRSGEDS